MRQPQPAHHPPRMRKRGDVDGQIALDPHLFVAKLFAVAVISIVALFRIIVVLIVGACCADAAVVMNVAATFQA
jgi:hypothetical protein